MVKFLVGMFDTLAWALRWAGVDYPQFRALLGVKLTLDGRRQFTAFQQQGGRASRNALAFTLIMNVVMGFFMAMIIPMSSAPLTAMTLVHGFVMVMVALSLIADFSSVLLDTKDNQILQPRPISSRTILAARMAHILSYIALLALSLSAASFVAGTIKYGLGFPGVLALTLAASVCLVVGAVNVLYLVAMRLTSGEKLRDIILYFQMFMTVIVVGGYQLLPRLVDVRGIGTWSLADRWWVYLIPPAWLAAPVELLTGAVDAPRLILTGLGVVMPLATLLTVLALAPGFKEALARLEATPRGKSGAPQSTGTRRPGLAAWITRAPVERAAFEFLWSLSGRDRQFKLRTYPSVALVLILGAAFLFSSSESLRDTLETLPQTHKHLFMLYMCCALAPTGFFQMRYSDHHEAAWIYRALPLATPGQVLRAGLKVAIVRLVMPSFALVALIVLAIWGVTVVPDLLLALSAVLFTCAAQALLMGAHFPFSEPFGTLESSGRFSRSLLYMLLAVALGGLHSLLSVVPYGVPAAVPLVALTAWLALRAYGRLSWRKVLAEEKAGRAPSPLRLG
jgi:ABC-2 type transport system permease protein